MAGFWVKAFIALALVLLVLYGATELWKARRGCLTMALMLSVFLMSPILWAIAYFNIPIYYLEPFKGRVVEIGTGDPIPGAAVLLKYYERFQSMEGWHRFIDAKETITNENGEYYIRSDWQWRRGGTPHGDLTIFKPGYSVEGSSNFNFLDTMFWRNYDHRLWNTGHQVYELRKLLTKKERLQNYYKLSMVDVDPSELKQFNRLMDEELRYLYPDSSKVNKK